MQETRIGWGAESGPLRGTWPGSAGPIVANDRAKGMTRGKSDGSARARQRGLPDPGIVLEMSCRNVHVRVYFVGWANYTSSVSFIALITLRLYRKKLQAGTRLFM